MFDSATLSCVHLDRPMVMTNASAMTVAWQAKYDPFGVPVAVTVTPTNTQRLPGQWFQSEDGLSYNWHRTYDPTIGRYTQADPLGFVDGPGIYNYADSTPNLVVDPTGLHKGDKWYGFNDPAFRWWYHRCYKRDGDPDADKETLEDAYAEWKSRGSPKYKCDGPPPISEPEPSPVCGPACATAIVIGGICCALAPEICIPGLAVGGALSQ